MYVKFSEKEAQNNNKGQPNSKSLKSHEKKNELEDEKKFPTNNKTINTFVRVLSEVFLNHNAIHEEVKIISFFSINIC